MGTPRREVYNEAYAEAIVKTSVEEAPWYVAPSNNKSNRISISTAQT